MIDFGSDAWATALRDGLAARLQRLPSGGLLACFNAGPFRVAYPDFLVGSPSGLGADEVAARLQAARSLRADLVRLQSAGLPHGVLPLRIHALGTTVIPALDQWREQRVQKARRASNRRRRSELVLRSGRASDGAAMHGLYASTVRRNGGAMRYSQRYFELIAPWAATIAEVDGRLCGYTCVGADGARACYMHGAHDPAMRQHYPSDALFLDMLEAARARGVTRFDFLPSPPSQPSLASYKLAWGAVHEPLVVADIALHPLRARAFGVALGLADRLSSMRRG